MQGDTLYFTLFDFGIATVISEIPLAWVIWSTNDMASLQEMLRDFGIHVNYDVSWFRNPIGTKFGQLLEMESSQLLEHEAFLVKYRAKYACEPPLGISIPDGRARM
jgi:hypothetical protein